LPRGWKPNADSYTNSYGDAAAVDANANAYSYCNDATSVAHAHGDCDGDNHAEAYAYAKAAANAVSSSDAVSEWAKRSKQLQSNRELARQLASSLLFRGDIIRSRFGLRAIRATTTEPRRRRVVKKLSQNIVKKSVLTGLRFSD
jgi:hypothetical protein